MMVQFSSNQEGKSRNRSHLSHHCIFHHFHNRHTSSNFHQNNWLHNRCISILQTRLCMCISRSYRTHYLHFLSRIRSLHLIFVNFVSKEEERIEGKCKPDWQYFPESPNGQVQLKVVLRSMQVPPFWHEKETHWEQVVVFVELLLPVLPKKSVLAAHME